MAQKAYVGINEDQRWALYEGDGTEDEQVVLAVGPAFEPGPAIQDVLRELQQWATENGYELIAPHYDRRHMAIEDLIEPEFYEEARGEAGGEALDSRE